MPLKVGSSRKVISANISELAHSFKRKKHKNAVASAIRVALGKAGKSRFSHA
jgi:hypothetical protein